MKKQEKLKQEIDKSRQIIKTDGYSMSIGEVIALFEDGDLILNPAYQRIFRWDLEHKTNFIESILLGIPIPEIFVAQDTTGKWTVVDGVQRLSTIFQFVGVLPENNPLELESTDYLPSLEGTTWEKLSNDIKRIFKRAKLNINIILTESSVRVQYDLFQRLNSGGIHLSDQELRNCLLITLDEEFYNYVNDLRLDDNFKKVVNINETKIAEDYDIELIIRYLIAKRNKCDYSIYVGKLNTTRTFLDQEISNLIQDEDFNYESELKKLKLGIKYLFDLVGEGPFRKYIFDEKKFTGQFKLTIYDALLVGFIENYKDKDKKTLKELIYNIESNESYKKYSDRKLKSISRFKELTTFSREYFKHE